MLILAFDTSASSGSVALLNDDTVLVQSTVEDAGTHAHWLMGTIDRLLKESGRDIKEVDLIALSAGPGSFTGLRIGVSTAKALAWALNIRVIGVSTLEALSMNLKGSDLTICPVLDARKGMVYAGLYYFDGGVLKTVMKESELDPQGLMNGIESCGVCVEGVIFLGNGIRPFGDALKAAYRHVRFAPEPLWRIHAANIGHIAAGRLKSGYLGVSPSELTPLYLRRSEAEVKAAGLNNKPSSGQG